MDNMSYVLKMTGDGVCIQKSYNGGLTIKEEFIVESYNAGRFIDHELQRGYKVMFENPIVREEFDSHTMEYCVQLWDRSFADKYFFYWR